MPVANATARFPASSTYFANQNVQAAEAPRAPIAAKSTKAASVQPKKIEDGFDRTERVLDRTADVVDSANDVISKAGDGIEKTSRFVKTLANLVETIRDFAALFSKK